MSKRIMRFAATPRMVNTGNHALSPEKSEVLAEILETQVQLVTNSSVPVDIEMVNVAIESNIMSPASEHKFTNPE
jgi:hypothetical protein